MVWWVAVGLRKAETVVERVGRVWNKWWWVMVSFKVWRWKVKQFRDKFGCSKTKIKVINVFKWCTKKGVLRRMGWE